jgi:UDP-N-acetyl-D-mannosaminuronic acid dehydrogenase
MAVGELLVVDPLVQQLPQSLAELGLSLTDFDVAVDRANVILLLVDHGAFKSIDRELIKDKIVVDTRGIW